jgi:hypothetical protein
MTSHLIVFLLGVTVGWALFALGGLVLVMSRPEDLVAEDFPKQDALTKNYGGGKFKAYTMTGVGGTYDKKA